jgi:enamine deaminase RidA (YjgF/YER057c/UK114 family)
MKEAPEMNDVKKHVGASPLHRILQPPGWPRPKGYANGILAEGRLVFTGGLVGWDENGVFPGGFVPQVRQTLLNIKTVLKEAGAGPEHLVRLTWYVISVEQYLADPQGLGGAYRETIGRYYPAMATIEVTRLVELNALVEIEATAVIP